MNRVFILIICLCTAISSKGQLRLGLEVLNGIEGFISSDITSGIQSSTRFGGFFRYPVQTFFIESGIYVGAGQVDIKRLKLDETFQKANMEWISFDIPFLLGHSFEIGKKELNFLSVSAGFYAMWYSNGNATLTLKDGQQDYSRIKIDNIYKKQRIDVNSTFYTLNPLKRWNIGGRIETDYIYKRWMLRLIASIGFKRYATNYFEEIRPYSISLGIGYYLRK